MVDHWFWFLLTAASILWYSVITVYVAFKAVTDIKNMLHRLSVTNMNEQDAKGPH